MTQSAGQPRATEATGAIPADTFAARVMLARMHAGYQSIDEAAAKCGITRQNWSNWEKGKKPREMVAVVEAISRGLGIDRDWLMFGGPLAAEQPRKQRRLRSVGDPTDRNRWLSDAITGTADTPAARPVTTRQAPPDNRPSGRGRATAPAPRTRRPARLPRPNAA